MYFSVPSGNFGNLTAGLFAKKMGLPITKMIAANNANDVFTLYHETGKFEPKTSVQTLSNAMDVGNPSNFARMMDLYSNNLQQVQEDIAAYCFNDEQTTDCIKKVFEKYNYLLCPHSAVGYLAMDEFVDDNDLNPYFINSVILATAHPVKFGEVVEPLIHEKVEIPERLKSIIDGTKKSISISANFDVFKTWLMDK